MKTRKETLNIHGAELTRRGFVKTGGALFVGFGLLRGAAANAATTKNTDRKSTRLNSSH